MLLDVLKWVGVAVALVVGPLAVYAWLNRWK